MMAPLQPLLHGVNKPCQIFEPRLLELTVTNAIFATLQQRSRRLLVNIVVSLPYQLWSKRWQPEADKQANNLSTRQRSYFDPINCWTKRWRPAVENRVKA